MTTKTKIIGGIIAALLLVGIGYGAATLRQRSYIAAADARETERMAKIAANDAENAKLRTDNDTLRKHVAELSAKDEAVSAIITERGGTIAAEEKKLEAISETLKNDQAVLGAPTDRCTRCRRFSATALDAKLIDKPLTCADECRAAN